MTLFISYTEIGGIQIKEYHYGGVGGDIRDFALAVAEKKDAYCKLDGAKDALEDGSIWVDDYASINQETLEMLHDAITSYRKSITFRKTVRDFSDCAIDEALINSNIDSYELEKYLRNQDKETLQSAVYDESGNIKFDTQAAKNILKNI